MKTHFDGIPPFYLLNKVCHIPALLSAPPFEDLTSIRRAGRGVDSCWGTEPRPTSFFALHHRQQRLEWGSPLVLGPFFMVIEGNNPRRMMVYFIGCLVKSVTCASLGLHRCSDFKIGQKTLCPLPPHVKAPLSRRKHTASSRWQTMQDWDGPLMGNGPTHSRNHDHRQGVEDEAPF